MQKDTSNFLTFPSGIDSFTSQFNTSAYAHTLFVNINAQRVLSSKLGLFLKTGIGLANVTGKGTLTQLDPSDPTTQSKQHLSRNFAWQIALGINYDININWSLDAGLNYIRLGEINYGKYNGNPPLTTGDTFFASQFIIYGAHIGIRYHF